MLNSRYILVINDYGEEPSGISSDDIYARMEHSVDIDYTDELDDPEAEIEDILSQAEENGIIKRLEGHGFEFSESGPVRYFGRRRHEAIGKLEAMSDEDFATDAGCAVYSVQQLLNTTYSTYVYYAADGYVYTLDEFIREYAGIVRYVKKDKPIRYTLENIYYYHS